MHLEIRGDSFFLNDEPFMIYSGAIHYFRVPREYWRDRLEKLKAAGLNTVETYVSWNLHEPKKGEFNFEGDLDLVEFLKLAQELGLYAIVRPGPYICAEWDLGGFPAWLLTEKKIRLRHYDEVYLRHVKDWYSKLFSLLVPQQITRGGNIIAMQVENEYGSFAADPKYLNAISDIMTEYGCEVLKFTADGTMKLMVRRGKAEGVYQALNFGSRTETAYKCLKGRQDNAPKTCMEFWDGWFDHWQEKHHIRECGEVIKEIDAFIDGKINFNLYMFHGGTNFGFTAGANYSKIYQPTVTSYDYNAPLSEWGGYTPFYHALREKMLKARGISAESLPLPPEPQLQDIGEVRLTETADLWSQPIGTEHKLTKIVEMEELGQDFGYVNYSTVLQQDFSAPKITLTNVHDLAYIYIDGQLVKRFWRNERPKFAINKGIGKVKYSFKCKQKLPEGTRLDILVEGMGRINYGRQIYDKKGLSDVTVGGKRLSDWTARSLPMDDLGKLDFGKAPAVPCFMKGEFTTESKADCFVHLDGFTKGFVVVNGHNLGRYRADGPQKALYLPGVWLNCGSNEIIVFEQEGFEKPTVKIDSKPDLG